MILTISISDWTRLSNSAKLEQMLDPNSIEDIAKKLTDSLPSVGPIKQDIESGFQTILAEMLNQLNLVSREEFDVQTAVLTKTRTRLEQLEKTVRELEQASQPDTTSHSSHS